MKGKGDLNISLNAYPDMLLAMQRAWWWDFRNASSMELPSE